MSLGGCGSTIVEERLGESTELHRYWDLILRAVVVKLLGLQIVALW